MLLTDIVKKVETDRSDYYEVQTNVSLLKTQIEMFRFPLSENYFEILGAHGPALAALCSKMSKVRGVKTVYVNPYKVSVHMAGINKITAEVRKIVDDFIDLCAVLEEDDTPKLRARFSTSWLNDGPITIDLNARITTKRLSLEKNFSEKKLVGQNTEVKKLLKRLLNIDGVTGVEVTYYQIVVNCAPLFDKRVIAQSIVDEYVKFVK